jgi:hypothetical protein
MAFKEHFTVFIFRLALKKNALCAVGNLKRLRSSGIDSKELIPPAYID